MGRPRIGGGFTITQLKSMLESRQTQLDDLERERGRITKQLANVDEKIRSLGGAARTGSGRGEFAPGGLTAGGRARNPKSLVGTLEDVLKAASAPMSVGDIVQAVQNAGYRSNSDSFRAIVNQTLIKERKRFANTARGMYAVK